MSEYELAAKSERTSAAHLSRRTTPTARRSDSIALAAYDACVIAVPRRPLPPSLHRAFGASLVAGTTSAAPTPLHRPRLLSHPSDVGCRSADWLRSRSPFSPLRRPPHCSPHPQHRWTTIRFGRHWRRRSTLHGRNSHDCGPAHLHSSSGTLEHPRRAQHVAARQFCDAAVRQRLSPVSGTSSV